MKTSSLTAALAACLFAAPLLAQPGHVTITERVAVADLDLALIADRSRLAARIRDAVHRACGTVSLADLKGSNAVRRCRAEAIAAASYKAGRLAAAARPATAVAALDE